MRAPSITAIVATNATPPSLCRHDPKSPNGEVAHGRSNDADCVRFSCRRVGDAGRRSDAVSDMSVYDEYRDRDQ
jgi:hypothetical protein